MLDSDWGTMLIEPADADVVRRVNQAFWDVAVNPFAGRRLRALLRAAGLQVDDEVGSSAYVLPQAMLAGGAMALPAVQRALAAGTVTQAEADAFLAGMREAAGRGAAFMSVTMFAVVGRH